MSLATDYLQATREGFANKDSGGLVELITDDFQLISPITTRSRQEFLDWVAGGGNSTIVDAVFDAIISPFTNRWHPRAKGGTQRLFLLLKTVFHFQKKKS